MPVCPACSTSNPEGNRFCGQCGALLEVVPCPSCAAANPTGQAFCGQCGTGLAGEAGDRAVPVDERKLATVLFADVVGFTSLAERTDPELVARMVDAAFVELGRVVAEHGGTVDKYMGDSLMAVFGVPVAHDDDAERAVAAGLAMRRLGGDLVFSIGVNSGEVMATAVGRGDVTVIGDTVNVAARLEKAAGPGEVLCGRLTAELARRHVEFRERRPVPVKGKSEPVEVFEAVRLRRTQEEGADGTRLVGRDDELAFLHTHWRRVRSNGQAQLVVLCGEAGAGKTRLLDQLASEVEGEAHVVRADYPAYGVLGGLRVAAELVEQLGPSADPDVEARVRSVVGELDPSLRAMDAEGIRHEQLWALGRLLKEKAAAKPLLIVVDDMHWSDERTLELLGDIALRLVEAPILTVVTGRTDPGTWLGRFSAATTLRLPPLAPAHAAELAGCFVGDKPLAADAREFLVELSNGNPLYLRELVAMARVRNMLVDDGDCYRITAHSGIPATLQALLAARLDGLERGHKQLVQHLALLGQAGERELGELGDRQAAGHLVALVSDGLVRPAGDARYEVADPLLREVAYDMLPRNVRGDLHRRAAATATCAEDRVRHLERATEYITDDDALSAEAAEALADEGRALCAAYRPLDAMRVLEKAAALGMRRPDALFDLARIQSGTGREDEAFATLALVADDPGDPALAVERDHLAANVKLFSDPAWTLPGFADAAARWHALGRTDKEAWAYANAGVAHFYLSQMDESAYALETALSLFESIGDRAGAVAATSFLALVRPADPRVDGWLSDALEFAHRTGDRVKQMNTLATLTWRHFFRGFCGTPAQFAEAEECATRLATLAAELATPELALHALSLHAMMARLTGRFDEAAEHVVDLQRLISSARMHDPWLAWAASFSVAAATGASGAAAPFPPADSVDPVTTMAAFIVHTELVLAGRLEEALTRLEERGAPNVDGALSDVGGLVYGVGLVLGGRYDQARHWVDLADAAARLLDGEPARLAAAALSAEARGDVTGLPPVPPHAAGVAEALVARAHARTGDAMALEVVRRAAKALGAPGLLTGLPT